MNTPRVSREQAGLLKKVGYDVKCHAHYECTKKEEKLIEYSIRENWNTDDTFGMRVKTLYYSAPTLDEAARWLREVKGWHLSVVINPIYIRKYMFVVVDMNSLHKSRYKYTPDENEATHDLALSSGIDLILKKLTDGK